MTGDPDERYREQRRLMVEKQLVARGITDRRVINAILNTPRHLFVPEEMLDQAYEDRALPIGPQQSISQPYIVALMLSALKLRGQEKVLEVGTGSGYQAALLGKIAKEIYTLDLDPSLIEQAHDILNDLRIKNVTAICGDGYAGLKDKAPFDAIVVSAAPPMIPRDLVRQLKEGGRMVLPLGDEDQVLVLLEKTKEGLTSTELGGVSFVPMKEQE